MANTSEVDSTSQEEFPNEVSDDVVGLMYLGELSRTFTWCGHKFVIRTLKIDEEVAVGQLVKAHQDTVMQTKALATAVAAACLVTVNGQEIVTPLGPDVSSLVNQRYHYIAENWYWPTIEKINTEYLDLVDRMYKAIGELEKKSIVEPDSSGDWFAQQSAKGSSAGD